MIQDEIKQMIMPTVTSLGYELWGCEYLAQGRHSVLRIYIDKPDGIGVEDCEIVSRQISALLDVNDPISGHYSLEVSSPGVPRPLFYTDQYERYVGHVVHIKLYKPILGMRTFQGEIVSADDSMLTLAIAGKQQDFLISNITKANLIV